MESEYLGCYRVPDGYFGETTITYLVLVGKRIIEVHSTGFHASPALYMDIQGADEAKWLIEHNPYASNRYR